MSSYVPDPKICDLYDEFTGKHGPLSSDSDWETATIGQKVAAISSVNVDVSTGPLVIINDTGVYVFDEEAQRIAYATTRTDESTGFYEVTALSHIGPAIAYLAWIKEQDGEHNDSWIKSAQNMLAHIRQVRALNDKQLISDDSEATIDSHWLDRLDNGAWNPHKVQIKNMFDYACSFSGTFLYDVLADNDKLTSDKVRDNFLNVKEDDDFPIPFNNVMIGTFQLEGLSEFYRLHTQLGDKDIDWENARVLVRNPVGNNYGAGLSKGSNWTVSALDILTGKKLNSDRVLIVAYAGEMVNEDGTTTKLFDIDENMEVLENYNMYSSLIFGGLYAQTVVTNEVYSDVDNIPESVRSPMPGDYSVTKVDQSDHIDQFVQRLKYSFGVKTQLLSNTIGFWIPDELADKDYKPENVDIPGLTTGFPSDVTEYPASSPAIPSDS